MPVCYQIDRSLGVVVTVGSGVVRPEDMVALIRRLAADPEVPSPLRELFDGRGVTSFELRASEVRQLFDLATTFRTRYQGARLAIVATSDVVYGMGRMAQTMAPFAVRVFRALEPAREWLLQDPGRGSPDYS